MDAATYRVHRQDILDAESLGERVWTAVFQLIDDEPDFDGSDAGEIAEAASRAAKRAILDVLSRC